MLKNHDYNNQLGEVTGTEFVDFFKSAMLACRELKMFSAQVNSIQTGDISAEDFYDELEAFYIDDSPILRVSEAFTSHVPAHNKYLYRTGKALTQLLKNIDFFDEYLIIPDDEQINVLQSEITAVIGGLSYFLFVEFGAEDIIKAIESGDSYDVDAVLHEFLGITGQNLESFVKELKQFTVTYKLKQDIFDEFPELEDPFMRVVGPDAVNIPEGFLTETIVRDVISGTLPLPTFLDSLEGCLITSDSISINY